MSRKTPHPPLTLSDWLSLLETRHPVPIDLGLERIRDVWGRMGRPSPAKRVVTVAGTNGKGSTVAYIAAWLEALGLRVGTYTSPHLLRYNERVSIGGREVSDADLLRAFETVEAARGETSLTYFEFGTLAAFDLLATAKLDAAVLEVGLGGRLDAVNLVDPDCAVITPVGLDHQEYLGPDRETIGREKAGIVRSGRPLVCTEAQPPESVLEVARARGAPVWLRGRDYDIERREQGWRWRGPGGSVDLPSPPLAGIHQAHNVAAALAAVLTLVPDALNRPEALRRGLAGVRVPGRLQTVLKAPEVLVDVGHNPLAAQVIADTFAQSGRRAAVCVIGMLRDKDAGGVAARLEGVVDDWHCCTLDGDRGRSGERLAGDIREAGSGRAEGRVRSFPDVRSGLDAAMSRVDAADTVLVFGSFLTASQAAEWARERAADRTG